MNRMLGALAAALSLLWVGAANAAVTVTHIDLDGYALGDPLLYGHVVEHPTASGRAVFIDALAADPYGIAITSGWSFLGGDFETGFIKARTKYQFDIYTTDGLTLQFPLTMTVLDPDATMNVFGDVKLKHGPAYLTNIYRFDEVSVTPEPETWALMMIGFLGVGLTIRAAKPVAVRR